MAVELFRNILFYAAANIVVGPNAIAKLPLKRGLHIQKNN